MIIKGRELINKKNMIKNISLIVLASFLLVSFASAAGTTTPAIPQDNGNPMSITQVWGLTGFQTPVVTCGYRWGCFDIRRH